MAAASPLHRRPGAVPVAALAALAVLVALAALAVGRATPGGLQDQGPAPAVTPPPVAQPLWPDLAASPPPTQPPTGAAAGPQTAPQPVPDVTLAGRDITTVDAGTVRTILAKDPAVTADERRALDSCPTCEIRSPEFRDLTGDGKPELIVAVTTPGPVVLHVYTPADDHLLPILRVEVLRGFSAAAVGSDLWLYEPTTTFIQTRSHYQWDGVRLVLMEQKLEGVGPVPGSGSANGTGPAVGSSAEPSPAASPANGRAPAPIRPSSGPVTTAEPTPLAPGAVVPSTRTAVPTPAHPTPAPPEAKP
ncbi:hypothetical protein [Kitasatospora sp. NPDC087314]|uniref:hypothetical protein n=1 Tax=Kitasatospora sp. NPDC087314 TaxID=3364068 RepID=UPI0037F3B173